MKKQTYKCCSRTGSWKRHLIYKCFLYVLNGKLCLNCWLDKREWCFVTRHAMSYFLVLKSEPIGVRWVTDRFTRAYPSTCLRGSRFCSLVQKFIRFLATCLRNREKLEAIRCLFQFHLLEFVPCRNLKFIVATVKFDQVNTDCVTIAVNNGRHSRWSHSSIPRSFLGLRKI